MKNASSHNGTAEFIDWLAAGDDMPEDEYQSRIVRYQMQGNFLTFRVLYHEEQSTAESREHVYTCNRAVGKAVESGVSGGGESGPPCLILSHKGR